MRDVFTSHYVSINSIPVTGNASTIFVFTSHYVSINSGKMAQQTVEEIQFTSHYVSINSETLCYIQSQVAEFTSHYVSINSLLHPIVLNNLYVFTSHYVSINSRKRLTLLTLHNHLHPTMYLLIPVIIKASLFLNSEALFCLPFKSANRLLILYALNMPEA